MPKATPGSPVARNGGGRRSQRQDLLKAAIELFAKEGSRGTPLAAVAERIGVTTPAITHHFGSKQGLLMEVVQATDETYEFMSVPPSATGIERLSGLRAWARALLSDSGFAHLSRLRTVMVAEALDPDFSAHDHFVKRHRQFRRNNANTVIQGQADGSIRKDVDPMTVATEIVAFMQGAQIQWLLDPRNIPLETIVDDYFDRLVESLTPPQGHSAQSRDLSRGS
jgi:AcrR family transcriptional regulator